MPVLTVPEQFTAPADALSNLSEREAAPVTQPGSSLSPYEPTRGPFAPWPGHSRGATTGRSGWSCPNCNTPNADRLKRCRDCRTSKY